MAIDTGIPAARDEVVREVYAAFNARDKARLTQLIDEDVIWHTDGSDGPAGAGPTRGRDAFLELAFSYMPHFESWRVVPEVVLTDGAIVMTRQRDDIVRRDGTSGSFHFNNYYEFNARNQVKEVWELTSWAGGFG
jgi:ketosteroid isomerase-like protein